VNPGIDLSLCRGGRSGVIEVGEFDIHIIQGKLLVVGGGRGGGVRQVKLEDIKN